MANAQSTARTAEPVQRLTDDPGEPCDLAIKQGPSINGGGLVALTKEVTDPVFGELQLISAGEGTSPPTTLAVSRRDPLGIFQTAHVNDFDIAALHTTVIGFPAIVFVPEQLCDLGGFCVFTEVYVTGEPLFGFQSRLKSFFRGFNDVFQVAFQIDLLGSEVPGYPGSGPRNVIVGADPLAPDLVITKTAAPDPVVAGDQLFYTVEVTNRGPIDATDVVMTDSLTPDVTVDAATSPCIESIPGLITCPIGTLPVGATETFIIVVTVDPLAPAQISNTAEVIAEEGDLNPDDNSVTIATTVISLVVLPDVVGLPQAAAEAAITAAGLTVGAITTAQSGVVPAGDVISQSPAAGASVIAGSPVDLVVSIGLVAGPGDIDGDGDVGRDDINIIVAARNTVQTGPMTRGTWMEMGSLTSLMPAFL